MSGLDDLEKWAEAVRTSIKETHGAHTQVLYTPPAPGEAGIFMVTLPEKIAEAWHKNMPTQSGAVLGAEEDVIWTAPKSAYLTYLSRGKGIIVNDANGGGEHIFTNIPPDAKPETLFDKDFAADVTIQHTKTLTIPFDKMDEALKKMPPAKAPVVVPTMPRSFVASAVRPVAAEAVKKPIDLLTTLRNIVAKRLGVSSDDVISGGVVEGGSPAVLATMRGLSETDYFKQYLDRLQGKDKQIVVDTITKQLNNVTNFKEFVRTFVKDGKLQAKFLGASDQGHARQQIIQLVVAERLYEETETMARRLAKNLKPGDKQSINAASINEKINGQDGKLAFEVEMLNATEWKIPAATLTPHKLSHGGVSGGRVIDNLFWLRSNKGVFNPSDQDSVKIREIPGGEFIVSNVDAQLKPETFFKEKSDAVSVYPLVRVKIPVNDPTMQAFGIDAGLAQAK